MCTDIFNKKFQTPNLGATFKRQRSYYVRKNKETLLLVDDSQGGCKHLSWQGFELHSKDVHVRLANNREYPLHIVNGHILSRCDNDTITLKKQGILVLKLLIHDLA